MTMPSKPVLLQRTRECLPSSDKYGTIQSLSEKYDRCARWHGNYATLGLGTAT